MRKMRSKSLNDLPMITQVSRGRAGLNQFSLILKHMFFPFHNGKIPRDIL